MASAPLARLRLWCIPRHTSEWARIFQYGSVRAGQAGPVARRLTPATAVSIASTYRNQLPQRSAYSVYCILANAPQRIPLARFASDEFDAASPAGALACF